MKALTFLTLLCVFQTASATKVALKGVHRRLQGSKKSSDEKTENEKSKSPKRVCANSASVDNVEMKCSSGKKKDTINYSISTGDSGVEVAVKYKNDTKTDEGSTKIEAEYEVTYYSLIEYLPESGNDSTEGYNWASDDSNVVQEIDLSAWGSFSEIQQSEDDVGVSHFHVSTEDEMTLFNFTLNTAVDPEKQLSANKIKIDVQINDFPWKRNDTLVALLCTIEAKTKVKSDDKSKKGEKKGAKKPKEVEVSFDRGAIDSTVLPFGEYTWVTTAEVTDPLSNITKTNLVVASSPDMEDKEDEKKQFIAFSFIDSNGASNIYWDPEAGVGYKNVADSAAGRMSGNTHGHLLLSIACGIVGLIVTL